MEKLSYKLRSLFIRIKSFFQSTWFLKYFDKTRKWIKKFVPSIIIFALLICFSYVFIYPILRITIDSFKTSEDLMNPDVVWLPKALTIVNYLDAANVLKIWFPYEEATYSVIKSTLWNSFVYSTLVAIIQTLVAGLTGYAFARFDFKGKKFWFIGLVMSFIIPIQILVLPRKMMLNDLISSTGDPAKLFHITETAAAYKFISIFNVISTTPILLITALGQGLNSAILIFIFFSFFKMIPVALDEAAQIDGANFRQIFYHVIIKMSTATILVVFLFSFVWNWNDTFSLSQLTYSTVDRVGFESLPQSLGQFIDNISKGSQVSGLTSGDTANAGMRGAGIMLSILPLLLLYAFTQKQFVQGIENTGVTGV